MIFKRCIYTVLIFYVTISQGMSELNEKEFSIGQGPVTSSIESIDKLDKVAELNQPYNNGFYFTAKSLINLAFGIGVGYGLYRYAPNQLPWIWAGTTTYTTVILGAAALSYAQENKELVSEKDKLAEENSILKAKNKKLLGEAEKVDTSKVTIIPSSRTQEFKDALNQQKEKTIAWQKRTIEQENKVENLLYVHNKAYQRYQYFNSSFNCIKDHNLFLVKKLKEYQEILKKKDTVITMLQEANQQLEHQKTDLEEQMEKLKETHCAAIKLVRMEKNPKSIASGWVNLF